MDFRQLECFLRVEECGSFTAAAEALRLAQPSLSRQIRLLEVELRHRLFIRHGRGVVPTEAGKVFAEQARLILRQADLARQSLDRMSASASGRLSIGIPSSLVKLVGVPLLTEFRNRLPSVSLSITDGLSISMLEWLLSGRLDIALLYRPLPCSEINSISLLDEELFVFSRASYATSTAPVAIADVAELPLILPRKPHEIRMLIETHLTRRGRKPKIVLEVDSIPAILQLLAPGEQFAILPKYAVSIYSQENAFVARRVRPRLFSKLVLATATKRATDIIHDVGLKLMVEVCEAALEPIRGLSDARYSATETDFLQ